MTTINTNKDAQHTVGTIITQEQKRDAIHIHVEPVIADEKLYPGQSVTLSSPGHAGTKPTSFGAVGIVDPFLQHPVFPGQYFWLFVYPRTVTSLRHVWTHPAFPDKEEQETTTTVKQQEEIEASKKWLETFLSDYGLPSYDTVITTVLNNNDDEYLHFKDHDAHGDIPSIFWDYLETITGKKLQHKPKFFTCSC